MERICGDRTRIGYAIGFAFQNYDYKLNICMYMRINAAKMRARDTMIAQTGQDAHILPGK